MPRPGTDDLYSYFDSLTHQQLVDMVKDAQPSVLSDRGAALTKAASDLADISGQLSAHSQHLEWTGPAADSFRDWVTKVADATTQLSGYATTASTQIQAAGTALGTAKAMPPVPTEQMTTVQTRTDQMKWATPDIDAQRSSVDRYWVTESQAAAAKAQIDSDHQAAVSHMVSLAQAYQQSTTVLEQQTPPLFPPSPTAVMGPQPPMVDNQTDLNYSGPGKSTSGGGKTTTIRKVSTPPATLTPAPVQPGPVHPPGTVRPGPPVKPIPVPPTSDPVQPPSTGIDHTPPTSTPTLPAPTGPSSPNPTGPEGPTGFGGLPGGFPGGYSGSRSLSGGGGDFPGITGGTRVPGRVIGGVTNPEEGISGGIKPGGTSAKSPFGGGRVIGGEEEPSTGRGGMGGMGGGMGGMHGGGAGRAGGLGRGRGLTSTEGGVVGGRRSSVGAEGEFTPGGTGLRRAGGEARAAGEGEPGYLPGGGSGGAGKRKDRRNRADYLVEDEETWTDGTPESNPDVIE
ncbi:hypothetical protein C7C46_10140 [Streptomyces tateyamensis]|uniref:PPE family domain-containing protein n=1 Tax=Streptomyces tateyamensis TaxID=565073 RepID=A0A2V4NFU1_9ACTN|nr:hypothetical protein [Streptomyces tateyamensis]PYC82705.1 hypothetical protein C7C46_10140 [Streptomyces tateyamensis]